MTSIYETLWRFTADGSISGIASKTANFQEDSKISDIGIAQPMAYAGFASALTDTDLAGLLVALQAEQNARG